MTLSPAITDLEELKSHPAVACLTAWNSAAVHGVKFDPDDGVRLVEPAAIRRMRAYLKKHVPSASAAPILETRVCQYENTPDNNFILDRHPSRENVWIVGGGSGHGFKHGPAVGEMVAKAVLDGVQPEVRFRLGRLNNS